MSSKKILAVPFLVLGLAVYGCSSDSGGGGGHGGSAGGSTGHGGTTGGGGKGGAGGTGGTGGATGGTGGATGGTGGATGGTGGATGGTGGATGGTGGSAGKGGTGGSGGTGGTGGAAMHTLQEVKDMCGTTVTMSSGVFTAEDFCTLYASTCTPPATGYNGRTMCEASFGALTTASVIQCRSYHLCNAENPANTADQTTLHCGHAVGTGLCTGN